MIFVSVDRRECGLSKVFWVRSDQVDSLVAIFIFDSVVIWIRRALEGSALILNCWTSNLRIEFVHLLKDRSKRVLSKVF